jgi:sterol desaturase/sphingolipid hydroxylase (fatty acid hydroxylase superfamily)
VPLGLLLWAVSAYNVQFPQALQRAFGVVASACDHPDPFWRDVLLFVVATNLWGMAVYWTVGGAYALLNFVPNRMADRYRVQAGRNEPAVDAAKFAHACRQVLFNQVVVGPCLALALIPLLRWRGMKASPQDIPSVHTFLLNLAGFVAVEEVAFFYSHRYFRLNKSLCERIHKQHHEWTAPVAITARYAHPLEDLLSNIGPVMLGPLVMGAHFFELWLWLVLALFSTLTSHSGFHLPFFPSPEWHDYHHAKFEYNFGVLGVMDRLYGTDSKFATSVEHERNVVLLGLKSAREMFP